MEQNFMKEQMINKVTEYAKEMKETFRLLTSGSGRRFMSADDITMGYCVDNDTLKITVRVRVGEPIVMYMPKAYNRAVECEYLRDVSAIFNRVSEVLDERSADLFSKIFRTL